MWNLCCLVNCSVHFRCIMSFCLYHVTSGHLVRLCPPLWAEAHAILTQRQSGPVTLPPVANIITASTITYHPPLMLGPIPINRKYISVISCGRGPNIQGIQGLFPWRADHTLRPERSRWASGEAALGSRRERCCSCRGRFSSLWTLHLKKGHRFKLQLHCRSQRQKPLPSRNRRLWGKKHW